jgi:hypothetical protein
MSSVTITPQNGLVLIPSVVTSTSATVAGVAAISGQIIRVYKLFLMTGGITNLTFQDGTTALSGALPFVANGSIALNMDGNPWFTTSAGNAFNIGNSGSSIQVSGIIYYTASTN